MGLTTEFVLEARSLSKTFTQGRGWQKRFHHRALENVSFSLTRKETLALVGESGSGKTTLAMCLVGLEKPDAGEILFNGVSLRSRNRHSASLRPEIQLIFQDSSAALNPRMSAIEIVEEPLLIRGHSTRHQRRSLAMAMMERVGVLFNWARRQPHELSGGQRQRLAIARALVLQPKVLILDEIFVGLDISIQGQIANLLLDLQRSQGLSYICILHNLALVSQIADKIAVMDKGQIVRQGTPAELATHEETSMAASFDKARRSAVGAHSGA
jgi:ABC-type glutathione transport system ATPase component